MINCYVCWFLDREALYTSLSPPGGLLFSSCGEKRKEERHTHTKKAGISNESIQEISSKEL